MMTSTTPTRLLRTRPRRQTPQNQLPRAYTTRAIQAFLRDIERTPDPPSLISADLWQRPIEMQHSYQTRHLFQALGFLGKDLQPTILWPTYSGATARQRRELMDQSLRKAHRQLFQVLPDADRYSPSDVASAIETVMPSTLSRQQARRSFLCLRAHAQPDVPTAVALASQEIVASDAQSVRLTTGQLVYDSLVIKGPGAYEAFRRLFVALRETFFT